MRGTASDVFGMVSDTWLRNIVRERRTVTSEIKPCIVSANILFTFY